MTADKFQMSKSKGFAIAAGIVSLNNQVKDKIILPEVGELQFYLKLWDEDIDELQWRKLKKRLCTLEDIRDESVYGFIPDSDAQIIDTFQKRVNKGILWCIDEEYEISGDYDAI